MLNKQLLGAILPGGVRTKMKVFTFILLAFVSLASCEDAMDEINVDNTEIRTGACDGVNCTGGGNTPPTSGGG